LQIILFHPAERLAQFGSGIGLCSTEPACRFLHLLFEPAERVSSLLAVVAEPGLLLALAQPIRRVAMGKHLAHARFLILFLFLEPVGFSRHCIHLLPGLSLLQPAQQVGSFLQAFRGAPRSGIILLALRSCTGHVLLSLTQAV